MSDPDPYGTAPLDSLDSDAPRQSARRGLVTAGAVALAVVAAGSTGALLARGGPAGDQAELAAATSSPTSTGDARDRAKDKTWKRGPGALPGRGGRIGAGGALHGTFVVPDGSGGYRTMVMQRGAATNVADSSITVRSEDGFEQTYAVTGDTAVGADGDGLAGIAKGADVAVVGQRNAGGLTALRVVDLAAWGGHGHGRMGGGPGDRGDGPPPPSSSPAEGSASGA